MEQITASVKQQGAARSFVELAAPSKPKALVSLPSDKRHVWAEWIIALQTRVGLPYEYFGHLTYRDAEGIPARYAEHISQKRFMFFIGEVNRQVYGNRWIRKGLGSFGVFCTEKHKSGFPHHHFLIGGNNLRVGIRRVDMKALWFKYFGYARIYDFNSGASAYYVAKYVDKGGVIDAWVSSRLRDGLSTNR